jgi:hypothetical protein
MSDEQLDKDCHDDQGGEYNQDERVVLEESNFPSKFQSCEMEVSYGL